MDLFTTNYTQKHFIYNYKKFKFNNSWKYVSFKREKGKLRN